MPTWATSSFICHPSCLDWCAELVSCSIVRCITSFLVNTATVDFSRDRTFHKVFLTVKVERSSYTAAVCALEVVGCEVIFAHEIRLLPFAIVHFSGSFLFLEFFSLATLLSLWQIFFGGIRKIIEALLLIAVAFQVETANGFALWHFCKWSSQRVQKSHHLIEICLLRMHTSVRGKSVKQT